MARTNYKFFVYRSQTHSFLRIFCILFPIFVFIAAYSLAKIWLYAVAIINLIVCLYFLFLLSSVIVINKTGLKLFRLFYSSVELAWGNIRHYGSFQYLPHGSKNPITFIYFSEIPLSLDYNKPTCFIPALTDKTVFMTVQPLLSQALLEYWEKHADSLFGSIQFPQVSMSCTECKRQIRIFCVLLCSTMMFCLLVGFFTQDIRWLIIFLLLFCGLLVSWYRKKRNSRTGDGLHEPD